MFPILNPLLPPSPYYPSGLSQWTSPKQPVSCIEPRLAICFLYDIIHVSMPFSQIIPPSPSPAESKSLFYTSVSLLLSRIQSYHYLDSILKNRDITLPTKVRLVKAMVFPVVMYGCEIWTGYERKLSTEELMLLNCGVREDS